jgi:hypothetical protein
MLGWFFNGRSLESALGSTKTVRVHGVKFKIRRINPLDYLAGSRAVRQLYDTYQANTAANVEIRETQVAEIKRHYCDTFLAAVVEPALKRTKDAEGEGLPVEHLLTDWAFANELYEKILEHTYGKKNLSSLSSLRRGASS